MPLLLRSGSLISIANGDSSKGIQRARNRRILRTPAGERSTFLTTGASKVLSAKTLAAAGTGAYLPTGIGWYRKQFTLPATTRGKRVVLQFDGVYQRSEVWINGTSLGMRPYGFITFSYDLTPSS